MAKGSDWYAACPHCKGSGSSSEPKEPRVHYNGDGSITPNPKYTPRPSDGKGKNTDLPSNYSSKEDRDDWREKKPKSKPNLSRLKYPDKKGKGVPNTKSDSQMQNVSSKEKKSKEPHAPNKEKYPDYKPKNPPMGGSSVIRKPKPKSPAGGAAKNR